ncbi:hypothetical protein A7M79_00810 [Acinetobacter baumannii]|uniref:hypothetical protein n=1 Tax=Acinetobacter baumannii TaxID=470 RepID=UPI0008DCC2C4|nr:hypothetical protein [Acinetobacter baumannii]OIH12059.1 hypothetical protein A7M79_00810 [Acinetobacter baumannii]
MLGKIKNYLNKRKAAKAEFVFNPMDFSHSTTLEITVKNDGTKEFRPSGYSANKGKPITTIIHESNEN